MILTLPCTPSLSPVAIPVLSYSVVLVGVDVEGELSVIVLRVGAIAVVDLEIDIAHGYACLISHTGSFRVEGYSLEVM